MTNPDSKQFYLIKYKLNNNDYNFEKLLFLIVVSWPKWMKTYRNHQKETFLSLENDNIFHIIYQINVVIFAWRATWNYAAYN